MEDKCIDETDRYRLKNDHQRSGCPLPLLFLTQSAASLAMSAIGFLLTAILAGAAGLLPSLLPHALLYGLGCPGMALAGLLCACIFSAQERDTHSKKPS